MRASSVRISYGSDERIFDTSLPIVALVALFAALLVVPRLAGTYWLDVLNRIGIAIVGALGLNILVGFTGQISIGQAAFLAVGAYSTAILEASLGLPFYLAIPVAALLTSVFGLVFGIPSLRLKGLYLAIATLAAHFITTYVIVHWERMTNGVLGFWSRPPASSGCRSTRTPASSTSSTRRWRRRCSSPRTCFAPRSAGRSSPSATGMSRRASWG